MEKSPPGDFTTLLRQWSAGDKSALNQLSPLVYQELRGLAESKLRNERSEHTLQPTALIHEAYIRMLGLDQSQWHSRSHFFFLASQIMRGILVDHARKHRAAKRGGGEKFQLDENLVYAPERGRMLIALDDALKELASFDERKSRLIEMKFFGGLKGEEIAEALGISRSTVTREIRFAEAWLRTNLCGE